MASCLFFPYSFPHLVLLSKTYLRLCVNSDNIPPFTSLCVFSLQLMIINVLGLLHTNVDISMGSIVVCLTQPSSRETEVKLIPAKPACSQTVLAKLATNKR